MRRSTGWRKAEGERRKGRGEAKAGIDTQRDSRGQMRRGVRGRETETKRHRWTEGDSMGLEGRVEGGGEERCIWMGLHSG